MVALLGTTKRLNEILKDAVKFIDGEVALQIAARSNRPLGKGEVGP